MADEHLANGDEGQPGEDRPLRADAQRSIEALLSAAKDIFATSGVEAPVREIADRAGVGVGTLYRRFPQRADLVAAVFQREMDDCADAAPVLAAAHPPFDALAHWLQRFAAFIGTKRGLAKILNSGDPAFDSLPVRFEQRLRPAYQALFTAAVAAGDVRADVDSEDLLAAVKSLCMSAQPDQAQRMIALLVDGLRYSSGVKL